MTRRLYAALVVAVALTLGVAAPAAAHVTVEPRDAVQGGYARVAFRVPNERDNASTTRVEVRFRPSTRWSAYGPCRCRGGT